ncbi:pollen-specific leucine-rich repeat extensin-like protein 1 [Culex quinquefasciatus]|uniref:pollen-specific leucine-rich repeat extensin-like protein 1 n=1 Tax=Culex quinquefasciatus TaxID=7176 RepID=UPI0018E2CB76|nr:pollen-specific leucine-rich repeat extensin-like protein 1 [Culex quinquefasciatus]
MDLSSPQVLQPLRIMQQAPPQSLTMPSSQPLVSPPPTMLSAQPLVKPQPPPPQIMPSLQPLISPPPPLTLAPPPPLITQPLQTAPLASTSAVTSSFHNELAARSSAVINANQQPTRPTVNFIPYPTSFTVTEGNHINVYGPSPPLLDQQLTRAAYPYPHNLSWPPFHPNQLTVPSVYQYMPLYSRMPEFSNIQQSTMV